MPRKLQKPVNPGRLLITGYLTIILLGAVLLYLPVSSHGITPIDALYTSTSAVCVTGLIVKDTATDFTLVGKIIILLLIQIGGLGYMILSTAFFFFIGQRLSLRDRLLVRESINYLSYENLRRFAFNVVRVTFLAEGVGALILFTYFVRTDMKIEYAAGHAIFHSVSAFCNAGFSSFSNNLAGYANSLLVPFVISTLFIMGGLGFVVISDVYKTYIRKTSDRLSLHSKSVLTVTACLIGIGTLIILLLEWNTSLKIFSLTQKIVNGFFMAVAPRTAGFNLINISVFHQATMFFIIILMFIGASSGGTGGGIKTTTFSLIILQLKALLTGHTEILIFKRRVSNEQIFKAFLIVGLAVTWVLTSLILLLIFNREPLDIMTAIFEIFSAFGTVGLSLGSRFVSNLSASYDYSVIGKLIIIMTMIIGRVGVLTLATALIKKKILTYTHPEGVILVG
ncbi:MAG: TrkH family potassium uptake protein [Candidatus Latescibacteria bacterium]|nr:TrkH family potassium uptake protein [Candidatus Latescibacterota bacterium]